MALAGKNGSVYLGANKVAELSSWSLDLGADEIEITSFDSNGWKEFLAGLKEWSGSCEGNFNLTDTNGQLALYNAWVNGTTLAVEFRVATTSPKFAGNIIITGISPSVNVAEKVAITFNFRGTGQLAYTA